MRIRLFVALAIMATLGTACASKGPQRLRLEPAPPGPIMVPAPPGPVQLKGDEIPECWSRAVKGPDPRLQEWYSAQDSCIPLVVTIQELVSDTVVCQSLLMPGASGRQMGPAIWAHLSEKEEWVIRAKALKSYSTDNRSEGRATMKPVNIAHVNNQGWYFRPDCPK